MYSRLIVDGNAVYEIDEECMRKRGIRDNQREQTVKKSEYQEKKKPYQR